MKKLLLEILLIISGFFLCCTSSTDKTLISWVELNDLSVRGGSVLTLQKGEQFDGIIFGELEPNKWIAGSDQWHRTQRSLENIAPENGSSTGRLIQMAIVYKGNEVRIYRDGKLSTNYKANNIDLLSSKKNLIVFGLRHQGGDGYVSAEIEDARIYARALSAGELRTLKPNVPSEIEPYAWWDFEDDGLVEKTGRYTLHIPWESANVTLEDGRLKLRRWGYLTAFQEYLPETPEWPTDPPENWLTFHLAHPGPGKAEPGDPNPAYFYRDRYHLHYIYSSIYGYSYAHLSSRDLIFWRWHRTVLTPPFTNHGLFSGTGFFTRTGQPAMIYHGFGSGRNFLCYALDDHLDLWTKPEVIEPKNRNGENVDMNHWDPDCWIYKNNYYALSGGRDPDLIKSDDLKNWTSLGKLLHDSYPDHLGVSREEDISCANMFKIGNRWMLLCISHRLGCRYFLGNFKDEKYLPESHTRMNWVNTNWEDGHEGLVYFAPESMLLPDGRRVMWAWVMGNIAPTGVQALPRELELPEDGVLRIRPLRELSKLRYGERVIAQFTVNRSNDYPLPEIQGDALELELTFKAPLPREFGIELLGHVNDDKGIQIIAGANLRNLTIGSINPPFELHKDEDLSLRIFIDKNLVEVFANDRQAAVVAHDTFRTHPNIRLFTRDKDLTVKQVKAWKMKSIFRTESSRF